MLEQIREQETLEDREKHAFLFNMSHDIRTPMNAIMGFADMIAKNPGDEELVIRAIDKVKRSSEVLMKLLGEVLELSHMENGEVEVEVSELDLKQFATQIRDVYELDMQKAGLDFVVSCEVQEKNVLADKGKLTQICMNLLSNAKKFTLPGGMVTFGIWQNGEIVNGKLPYRICVKDTGIGMSEEFQKHVFEIFEREQDSTNSGVEGCGIGLTIIQELTKLMGGTITVHSVLGQGTEFVIDLKLEVVSEESEKYFAENENSITTGCFHGKRVLIVEDNELNREITSELLKDEGFLIEEAANGVEAIDKVIHSRSGYFDLILMDIQMPVMDGYKATREIRRMKESALAGIPIVALTANTFEEDKKKCFAAGMNGQIEKPINRRIIRNTLANILNEV